MDTFRSRSTDRKRNRDRDASEIRQPSYRNKPEKTTSRFRFEDLDIWKMAIEISNTLYDLSDELEEKQRFLLAGNLREFALEIVGNIADGTASSSDTEFDEALINARRYIHRAASILFLLNRRKLTAESVMDENLEQLNILSRKMYSLQKSLRGEPKKARNYPPSYSD